MKYNLNDLNNYEDEFGAEPEKFQRIKRSRPEKDEDTRTEGRKLNHRTKKKKDIDF